MFDWEAGLRTLPCVGVVALKPALGWDAPNPNRRSGLYHPKSIRVYELFFQVCFMFWDQGSEGPDTIVCTEKADRLGFVT